ncbi:MAG: histidine phosphatase family protein [Alphaproteobacteria bacterium]
MVALALIRHAPTEWNAKLRIQGRSDIELSEEGRERAKSWKLPAELDGFAWVCSPLKRARQTAKLLGAPADCPSDARLQEADWGEWEGRVLPELRAELGQAMARNEARGLDLRPPGGESPREVRARLRAFVIDIAKGGRDTIAVTHNGILRASYSLATGWDFKSKPEIALQWGAAYLYEAGADGGLGIRQLDISLSP